MKKFEQLERAFFMGCAGAESWLEQWNGYGLPARWIYTAAITPVLVVVAAWIWTRSFVREIVGETEG